MNHLKSEKIKKQALKYRYYTNIYDKNSLLGFQFLIFHFIFYGLS